MPTPTQNPGIVSVTEVYGRSSDTSIDEGTLGLSYQRRFQVKTADPYIGGLNVRTALGLPKLGDAYSIKIPGTTTVLEHDDFVACRRIHADQRPDSVLWDVTVDYAPYDFAFNNVDPTQNEPKCTWSWQQFQTPADFDNQGNAVTNSALDQFDPPLMRDRSMPLLTIEWFQTTYRYDLAVMVKDAVNQNTWYGFNEGVVKVLDIQPTPLWHPIKGRIFHVVWQFGMNPEGWQPKVLDAGTRQLVADGSGGYSWQNIVVGNGETNCPSLLDGAGSALDPDPVNPNAVFLDVPIYNEIDFVSVFNFPPLDLGLGPGIVPTV